LEIIVTKTQDTSVLDGQSSAIISNALLGNTTSMKYRQNGPWDIEKLINFGEVNLPKAILTTDGISLVEDDPQIISRDDILPLDWPEAFQVRVSANVHWDSVNVIKEDICGAAGWAYNAPLPVLEKLKTPIKKANGKGSYLYRVVEGRHRFHATMDYKDFPCYVVKGHEADIRTLAQALNNPDSVTKKRDNNDQDVQSTVQEQLKFYDDTNGKYGVKPEVSSIIDYLKKNFHHVSSNDRKSFAHRCLSAEGILKDLEDLKIQQQAALLREYHPDTVLNGKKDSKGRVGLPLRIGRTQEQNNAFIDMAESYVKYYQEGGVVPDHYFIGSFTMGAGVNNQPTTLNLDKKRQDAQGIFLREFVLPLAVPLVEMYNKRILKEPELRFIAQNNGKGETQDILY
jgi:hypothetical protein